MPSASQSGGQGGPREPPPAPLCRERPTLSRCSPNSPLFRFSFCIFCENYLRHTFSALIIWLSLKTDKETRVLTQNYRHRPVNSPGLFRRAQPSFAPAPPALRSGVTSVPAPRRRSPPRAPPCPRGRDASKSPSNHSRFNRVLPCGVYVRFSRDWEKNQNKTSAICLAAETQGRSRFCFFILRQRA